MARKAPIPMTDDRIGRPAIRERTEAKAHFNVPPPDQAHKVISRTDAIERGLPTFFTGYGCPDCGKTAERETRGGECVVCRGIRLGRPRGP